MSESMDRKHDALERKQEEALVSLREAVAFGNGDDPFVRALQALIASEVTSAIREHAKNGDAATQNAMASLQDEMAEKLDKQVARCVVRVGLGGRGSGEMRL
jgi:hypothetical protein